MSRDIRLTACRAALVLLILLFAGTAQHAGASDRPQQAAVGDFGHKGPVNAPVTLLEFADFECPYTAKVAPLLKQILQAYPSQVQLIVKNSPLNIHVHSQLAHEAVLAAGAQGKYWEMQELVLRDQQNLDLPDLQRYARQIGLDMNEWQAAIDSHKYRDQVLRDLAEAEALDVRGTPTLFINGKKIVGLRPMAELQMQIEAALRGEEPPAENAAAGDNRSYHVNTESAFKRGNSSAPVKIVQFSDLRCPYCAMSAPALRKLMDVYPAEVEWIFKSYPLEIHSDAMLAHQAALAAGQQGKFWLMHDLILDAKGALSREKVLDFASQIHLDMKRFQSDLDSAVLKATIIADQKEGDQLGVHSTPTFFINGKRMSGAMSLEDLEASVERGLNESTVAEASTEGQHSEPETGTLGTKGAPVEIVWFSDIESPLSASAAGAVFEVLRLYPGKVRVQLKHAPLEFHRNAILAHEATLAAGSQGKFWEMYKLLVANPKALATDDLIRYAHKLGLDETRFRSDLLNHTYRGQVRADLDTAQEWGIKGAPVFFINSRRVDGVQSISSFRELVDSELRLKEIREGGAGR